MMTESYGYIKRFTIIQRLFHLLLMISFLIQTATGVGRMFYETSFGKDVVLLFGGYEHAAIVHKWTGIFMLCLFVLHLFYVLAKVCKTGLFGPDSLVPGPKDLVQFIKHTGWILGLAKHPELDRWGYWEKFDYWAVFWGMVIIGISGIMLAFPIWTSDFVPGWTLNLAFWVHRIEAGLAIAHVFIIHFFIAHVRRHNFPMDMAMFEGAVPMHKVREERPSWVARVGKSELQTAPHPAKRIIYYVFGFAMVASCLYLLIRAIINFKGVTW